MQSDGATAVKGLKELHPTSLHSKRKTCLRRSKYFASRLGRSLVNPIRVCFGPIETTFMAATVRRTLPR